jgi:hypothetical protein
MTCLVYQGKPNELLLEDNQEIRPGEDFEVSAQRAEQLLDDPTVNVIEVTASVQRSRRAFAALKHAAAGATLGERSLEHLTREQLNELAGQQGVANPEGLASKSAVIAALNNHNDDQEVEDE